MNHSPMEGIAAQGPLPAGMLRIRQGSQERYVWPVHLPGWLGLGWRVAGAEATAGASSVGVAAAEPPAPIAAAAAEALEPNDAKPASTRGRRGRRRKEEPEQLAASADTGTSSVSDSDAVDPEPSEQAQEAEYPAAPIAEPEPDPAGDHTADAPMLTALPDDLFDDPLL
jgi:hypothetical protein